MMTRAEIALVWRLFRADAQHNRKRIALTVLAIGWGTLSIVLLLSFGEGMKRAMSKSTRGMGEFIGVLWPGATTKPYAGLPSGRKVPLGDDDAEMLLARIPSLADVSREYVTYRSLTYGTKTVNNRIRGVDPSFGELRNVQPRLGGRFVNERDMAEKRRVVFLGEELAGSLFGAEEPIGKMIRIDQSLFLVVGVAEPKSMMGMYSGPDKNQATIPAATFRGIFPGVKPENFVYKPRSAELGDQAKAEIYRIMGARYRFDPEDQRALGIWDTRENQRVVDNIGIGIQMFLGIIGVLTLFVGGMGVANIMYAVVKERTREIGLKMALGGKQRHIMLPFVLQALLMTAIGGVLGTLVGLALIGIVSTLPLKGEAFDFLGRPTFSLPIAMATSVILGTVGALAGYFPARRASSIQPAESLRYE